MNSSLPGRRPRLGLPLPGRRPVLALPLVLALCGQRAGATTARDSGPAATPALERLGKGMLPPLALTDTKGNPAQLDQYRGKVLVLNFWATWCAPCLAEMPSLQRLHQALQGRDAVVVGVSVGDARMSVERFIETHRIDFPILMDADKTQHKRWKVGILPTTFVLDAKGTPRFRHVGERAWDGQDIVAVIDGLLAPRTRRG